MIKAAAKTKLGVPVLILGLSGENVTRLAAGEPIRVSAAAMRELGLPQLEVVLHYGRTEDDILAELSSHGVTAGDFRDQRTPGGSHGR
ncbi:MAG TPA: hypothetical protein VGD91_08285 [Trebonia sp.]